MSTRLRYSPPAQSNPTRRTVTGGGGITLDANTDYILTAGSDRYVNVGSNGLTILGGRVVVWAEGATIDAPGSIRALYLRANPGIVFLQGIEIINANEGIDIHSDQAVVYIQDYRCASDSNPLRGSQAGHHADIVQMWGGPRKLYMDCFEGWTQYQGFMIQPYQYGNRDVEDWRFSNGVMHQKGSGYLIFGGYSIPNDKMPILTEDIVLVHQTRTAMYQPSGVIYDNDTGRDQRWAGVTVAKSAPSPLLGNPGRNYVNPGYEGSSTPPPPPPDPTPNPDPTPDPTPPPPMTAIPDPNGPHLGAYRMDTAVPSIEAEGVSLSPITLGNGAPISLHSDFGYPNGPVGRLLPTANARPAGHKVLADSIAFTITPDPGNRMDIANVTVLLAKGGTSTPRSMYVYTSLDGEATTVAVIPNIGATRPGFDVYEIRLPGHAQLDGPLTVRGYFATPGTSLSIEVDSVFVVGTVVAPLPTLSATAPVVVAPVDSRQQFKFNVTPAAVVSTRTIRYHKAASSDQFTVDPIIATRAGSHTATVHDADGTSGNPKGTSYEGFIRLDADGYQGIDIPITWTSPAPVVTEPPTETGGTFIEITGGVEYPLVIVGAVVDGVLIPVTVGEPPPADPLDTYSDTY